MSGDAICPCAAVVCTVCKGSHYRYTQTCSLHNRTVFFHSFGGWKLFPSQVPAALPSLEVFVL